MVYLLAHCLSAMAFQSAVNPALGLSYLSETSFLAGIASMLIHLDQDGHNGKRTPLLHSVLFGVIWSLLATCVISAAHMLGLISARYVTPLVTVLPVAFASHLLADAFTEGGIYLVPRSSRPADWFQRKHDSENSWSNWKKVSLPGKRRNDDPILNFCVSAISLIVLIVLLGLTPL